MEDFIRRHFDQGLDVAERNKHPQQQKDALTIVVPRKRDHEEIADRLLRLPDDFSSASIEVTATQRSHGIVDLEAVHPKDLDRATQAQSSKCGGCRWLFQPESCLQDVAGFRLIERDIAETEPSDGTALVIIVAVEYVSEDQFLSCLDDVRAFLNSCAKFVDLSVVLTFQ